MKKELVFTDYIIYQTVFGEWALYEFDGISYLYPKFVESRDMIEEFSIEKDFIEEILNLSKHIYKLQGDKIVYIPTPFDTIINPNDNDPHEYIKDKHFDFFKDENEKNNINTALLNIFNKHGIIPLDTVYANFSKFIFPIMEDRIKRKKRTDPILFDCLVPTGLLAYTLQQLFHDFIQAPNRQENFHKTYDTIIRTDLTYNQGILTFKTSVLNLYEALKIYLINDISNENFSVKRCTYCGKIFSSDNPKKERCSRKCTDKFNSKKHYDKKKEVNYAKTKK